MNITTIQALARATPRFNIPLDNEDTKPWSIWKTLRCRNCKTVACNRKTYTRPLLILENDRLCFNCRTVGCHFWNCPHPIDEARYKRNKTLFYPRDIDDQRKTCKTSSLKVPSIESSGNQVQDTNRQRMSGVEAMKKAAWLETKKNLTQHQRYVLRFPLEEEHGKRVIHWAPHIWDDKTCSWTMTNIINNATSSDAAAAAVTMASTVSDAP